MGDCGGSRRGDDKGIREQLEAIREVLKNCCCGLLCKLKKIRGTCISVSESVNSLETPCPKLKVTIDEDEVIITKIHAAFVEFVEDPTALIDIAIITVKDRKGDIVFQDGFGDNITNIGIERYETTFVHPLLVKGPVCVELAFFSPSTGFNPVHKLGALTVVYCKDSIN